MRQAARVDANQSAIVLALRQVGASVQLLHVVGSGCPDIVVGYRGKNYLIEIKVPGAGLTGKEPEWHQLWRGQIAIVYGVDEALEMIGAV